MEKKEEKRKLVSGMKQIKESLLTRGFNLQCRLYFQRKLMRLIPILKQIEKTCFLVVFPVMWYCATETAAIFMLITLGFL